MTKRQFLANRRQFLKATAGAAAFFGLRRGALAFYQSPGLTKFNQALRTFNNGGLTLADVSDGTRTHGTTVADHYTINMGEFTDNLHPELGGDTKLWGYFQAGKPKKHLGGTILAMRDKPIQITFVNQLPPNAIIPIDFTLFDDDLVTDANKAAVHLHGGFVPWVSDGGPYDWFTPTAHGPSFYNNETLGENEGVEGRGEYYYPNQQTSRLMWYHDHAHGITRTNAYAGLASAYVLRDAFENNLISTGLLPSLATAAEIPLIFQDKIFVTDGIETADPTWPVALQHKGYLWYPHIYEGATAPELPPMVEPPSPGGTARWERDSSPFVKGSPNPKPLPDVSVIPEMFGDTVLVNGTVSPFVQVEGRRYRFRVLNACNARFLNLQLYVRYSPAEDIHLVKKGNELDSNANPVLAPANRPGPAIYQIGTEGGFLPAPVVLNNPPLPCGWAANGNVNRYNLLLAPAERADVVIDFKGFEGASVILYSDTPAPFPGGDIRNDYFYGMADTTPIGGSPGPHLPYVTPDTRALMEFRVVRATVPDPIATTDWLGRIRSQLGSRVSELIAPNYSKAPRRAITINETFDQYGRLVQLIGTSQPGPAGFLGDAFDDVPTEIVDAGATEIWEVYNLTGDTHPLHFHLVNLQILNRQAFDVNQYPGNVVFLGPPRMPDLNERGWKETIRMHPGEVTRVVMQFALPKVPFEQPNSRRISLMLGEPPDGKIYHEYVYHCHILEHEEHDMMRPLIVRGPAETT